MKKEIQTRQWRRRRSSCFSFAPSLIYSHLFIQSDKIVLAEKFLFKIWWFFFFFFAIFLTIYFFLWLVMSTREEASAAFIRHWCPVKNRRPCCDPELFPASSFQVCWLFCVLSFWFERVRVVRVEAKKLYLNMIIFSPSCRLGSCLPSLLFRYRPLDPSLKKGRKKGARKWTLSSLSNLFSFLFFFSLSPCLRCIYNLSIERWWLRRCNLSSVFSFFPFIFLFLKGPCLLKIARWRLTTWIVSRRRSLKESLSFGH